MAGRGRTIALLGALGAAVAATRLVRYEIAEASMEPTLSPGDWTVGVRAPRRLRTGDVVVVDHPEQPGFELVKRVAAIGPVDVPGTDIHLEPGEIWVLGDHAAAGSVDSTAFGPLPRSAVRARLVARYHPLPLRWIR